MLVSLSYLAYHVLTSSHDHQSVSRRCCSVNPMELYKARCSYVLLLCHIIPDLSRPGLSRSGS